MYFWNRTLHVSDRFSVHHRESSTRIYTAIGICHTGYDYCLLAGSEWKLRSTAIGIYHTGYVYCLLAESGWNLCSTAIGICHTGYVYCLLAGSEWNLRSTAIGICHTGYVYCLLAGNITCMTYTYCCIYSTRLAMIDRKPDRNM
jgi:hypothetical protein